jgi:uncharacterized OsmC-like protein
MPAIFGGYRLIGSALLRVGKTMKTITASLTEGTVTRITNGRHTWTGDEPLDAGGTDVGPNPYELLLGSLAACTCITLQIYARHKSIPLRAVHTTFRFDRIHAEDCADCDDDTKGFIDQIESDIRIEGDFTDAQRKRLAEVAVRCPVHKTLAKSVHFRDTVVVDETDEREQRQSDEHGRARTSGGERGSRNLDRS